MYSIKKLSRQGFARLAHNKNRKFLLKAKGIAKGVSSNVDKRLARNQNFDDRSPENPFHTELLSSKFKTPEMQILQTNGLLDLVPKKKMADEALDLGDFAGVSPENFVHALSFSKAEIDIIDFTIGEVETVCSQMLEQLSRSEQNRRLEDSFQEIHMPCPMPVTAVC